MRVQQFAKQSAGTRIFAGFAGEKRANPGYRKRKIRIQTKGVKPMTGMERIIAEIESAAEAEAKAIVDAASKEADAILKKTEEECSAYKSSAKEKAEKSALEAAKRTESQCQQQEKMILLRKKQEIIRSVIEKAKNKLENQSAEDYFSMLLTLLTRAVTAGNGELFLSEKDLARKPASFDALAEALAKAKGGSLVVSKEPAAIPNGFLLKYGQVEENYSLSAVFEEKYDLLQDKVHAVLW